MCKTIFGCEAVRIHCSARDFNMRVESQYDITIYRRSLYYNHLMCPVFPCPVLRAAQVLNSAPHQQFSKVLNCKFQVCIKSQPVFLLKSYISINIPLFSQLKLQVCCSQNIRRQLIIVDTDMLMNKMAGAECD